MEVVPHVLQQVSGTVACPPHKRIRQRGEARQRVVPLQLLLAVVPSHEALKSLQRSILENSSNGLTDQI